MTLKECRNCTKHFKDEYDSQKYCQSCKLKGFSSYRKTDKPLNLKSITERVADNPVIHKLKTWPEFYGDVESGLKPFELRQANRDFREGDYLCLQEFRHYGSYTGRKCWFAVTYILKGKWGGLADGWLILGIRKVKQPEGVAVLRPKYEEKIEQKTPEKIKEIEPQANLQKSLPFSYFGNDVLEETNQGRKITSYENT